MKESITIRDLRTSDVEAVSELGIRSKASWGYTDEEMSVFARELTISPSSVANYFDARVAMEGNALVGYYTLKKHQDGMVELEHLFVCPNRFREGIGRALLNEALLFAGKEGITSLTLIADPNSAGFYLKHGARHVGEHQSSISGRSIPVFEMLTNT